MRFFFNVGLALIGLFIALSMPVFAQNKPDSVNTEIAKSSALDDLFVKLSKAKTEQEARVFAEQIEQIWSKSGSDTADLLMSRVNIALKSKQYSIALDLVDSVIALEPKWAEAWNRRATILFLQNDYDGSMRDIRQVLAIEPRHYMAIGGISLIYQGMENKKLALKAARQALAIYPFMAGFKDYVETTSRSVDGDDL